jgi:hypothetical protein
MAIAPVPISELPKPREVGVPAAPGLLGRVLGLKDTESERRIGDAGVIAAVGGRGVLPGLHSPEMLVERVFLVGGVVKTVFCRFKKKEIFFSTRTKGSKADFVVISKSPLFSTETLRICSITSWFNFFLPEETAGEILCVSVELVLYFFFPSKTAGENSLRVHRTCSVFFLSVRNGGRKFYA